MIVGKLAEIWRYPVKSMGGETLSVATIDAVGMLGDRAWTMVDAVSGDICGAKTIPGLLNLQAQYLTEPADIRVHGADVPAVEVRFPDSRAAVDAQSAGEQISEYVGKPLRLHPLEPSDNLEHYRASKSLDEEEMARIFNIQPGEAGPDLSSFEDEILAVLAEYSCPPGTYYDVFPLHLLTSASLAHMQQLADVDFDRRRFRPSLYIETSQDQQGLAEFEWVGQQLRIGETLLQVASRTIRCSMPARAQEQYGLAQAPAVSKALYQATNRHLGVNVSVIEGGSVRAGDEVELI
jgi:uncharacterized protein YcbX